jgi:hypothetical protein
MPFKYSGFHLLDDEQDLVALMTEIEPDRLSRLITDHFGNGIKKARDIPASWGPLYYFPAERVAWVVSILSILMSAILLIGAMISLYEVTSKRARLGLVAAFTVFFAASIGLLTNAKRTEIFTATAA